jgi:hydroxyacylglutathione hydrolase
MKIIQMPVGEMDNFTYIIADENSKEAIVIDPSWEVERILARLNENQWKAKYIINTHTHFDHILGNEQLHKMTDAKIVQHENSTCDKHIAVSDGDKIMLGNIEILIVFTPGHSNDSICLIADNKFLFSGDTLFVGNCGRADLPGSNPADLFDSLYVKFAKLDDSLVVYPGHDYGSEPTSTLKKERKTNHVLQARSKQDFVQMIGGD